MSVRTHDTPPPKRPAGFVLASWATRLSAVYFVAISALTAYLWVWADDAWPATLLLFSPRWPFLVPLALLLPLAAVSRSRKVIAVVALAAWVAAVPFSGLVVSVAPLVSGDRPVGRIRVLTCNTNASFGGRDRDTGAYPRLLSEWNPDVLFLQECNALAAEAIPVGWKPHAGPSGLVFASRFPFKPDGAHRSEALGSGGAVRYAVQTPAGELLCVNLHLPTPRDGLAAALGRADDAVAQMNAVIGRRREASHGARNWVGSAAGSVMVAGDFNLPPESRIFRRDWSDLGNAFGDAGNGFGHTKYTSHHGVRIDHILYAPPWRCVAAWVGPDVGSDHRPLFADFTLDLP